MNRLFFLLMVAPVAIISVNRVSSSHVQTGNVANIPLTGTRSPDTLQPRGEYNVYKYQPPEFFTKTESAERLEFSMRNNDTSFCRINLYPAGKAGRDSMQEIKTLWSTYVYKAFSRADSLPVNIMSGNKIDGWQSVLGLGNCYVGGKKCVMMLFSFRRDTLMAFSTALMSERIFKPPVESFYQSLHLLLPPKTEAVKKGTKG